MNAAWRNCLLLAPVLTLVFSGCLSPILVAPSSAPLEGRSYVTTGKTTGEACMSNILGIPISTDASLKTAMKNAMNMASAQALIDIVVDNRYIYTLFFNRSCTVVHATGIRFTSQPAPYLPATPAVPPLPPTPGVTPPAPEPAKPPAVEEPATPAPQPKPAVPVKKLTRAEKRTLAAEKRRQEREAKRKAAEEKRRKAEEAKKAALARKQAEAKKVPDQYETFCRYVPGDQVRVETKSRVVEGEFVGCKRSGILLKAKGQPSQVIPFEQVWMVKLVSGAKPKVKPIAPIAPDTTKPAQPRTPAQPRKPAVPR